ncbi:MAG: hypothetical protein AAF637_07010 [Pseudomonadota bacterium]
MNQCLDPSKPPGVTVNPLDEAKDLQRRDASVAAWDSGAKPGLDIPHVLEKRSAIDRDFDTDLHSDPTRFWQWCEAKAETAWLNRLRYVHDVQRIKGHQSKGSSRVIDDRSMVTRSISRRQHRLPTL